MTHTARRKMPFASESMAVTLAREARRIGPFLAGFGIFGFGVYSATAGATFEARTHAAALRPGDLRACVPNGGPGGPALRADAPIRGALNAFAKSRHHRAHCCVLALIS